MKPVKKSLVSSKAILPDKTRTARPWSKLYNRHRRPTAWFWKTKSWCFFNTTAQHYVTPKFYVETKPTTVQVVPTWNYAAAQVYGRARIYWDSKSDEGATFLSKQIRDLSEHAETSIMGYVGTGGKPGPWQVSKAPSRYVELLQKNIVGIEIKIDRLEGKYKMSLELSAADREGVIQKIRGFVE